MLRDRLQGMKAAGYLAWRCTLTQLFKACSLQKSRRKPKLAPWQCTEKKISEPTFLQQTYARNNPAQHSPYRAKNACPGLFQHSQILLLQSLEFGILDLIHICTLQLDNARISFIAGHCIQPGFDGYFKTKRRFGLAFFDCEIF